MLGAKAVSEALWEVCHLLESGAALDQPLIYLLTLKAFI